MSTHDQSFISGGEVVYRGQLISETTARNCDRRIAARVKGNVYKMVVMFCWDVWCGDGGTDKQTGGQVLAVLKMLRMSLLVTIRDRTRNEYI